MSSNDDAGGPVVTPSSPDQASEVMSSRRLRIEEIKERRRRFHKETAERWILEQQFGVEDGGGERGADGVDYSGEKRDRKSFLDAFEFFSKGCDDGGRRGSSDSCEGGGGLGEGFSGRVAARRRLDGERE